MPNDCLRTVKVSRAPAPCRLSTIPSKTCTRRRVPSMTWKCTRTVSPALKRGTLRNWARSRSWMTLLMAKGPDGRRAGYRRAALSGTRNGTPRAGKRGFRPAPCSFTLEARLGGRPVSCARARQRPARAQVRPPAKSPLRGRLSLRPLVARGSNVSNPRALPLAQFLSARPGLAEGDPVRRPVDEEHDPDQLVPGHRAPRAGVAGLRAVVAHHEIRPLRDVLRYAE